MSYVDKFLPINGKYQLVLAPSTFHRVVTTGSYTMWCVKHEAYQAGQLFEIIERGVNTVLEMVCLGPRYQPDNMGFHFVQFGSIVGPIKYDFEI